MLKDDAESLLFHATKKVGACQVLFQSHQNLVPTFKGRHLDFFFKQTPKEGAKLMKDHTSFSKFSKTSAHAWKHGAMAHFFHSMHNPNTQRKTQNDLLIQVINFYILALCIVAFQNMSIQSKLQRRGKAAKPASLVFGDLTSSLVCSPRWLPLLLLPTMTVTAAPSPTGVDFLFLIHHSLLCIMCEKSVRDCVRLEATAKWFNFKKHKEPKGETLILALAPFSLPTATSSSSSLRVQATIVTTTHIFFNLSDFFVFNNLYHLPLLLNRFPPYFHQLQQLISHFHRR
ncbi:hypothetical protein PIB30_038929 [Stylosanthes scabra]|uniref:Uncharacterized protein n=1 Tax=Stylosanthes scabra TaxID=79078 RepID=A0ABU6SFR7_9FABA|nr:hypothetical protein [Stylosanthes scabra]